MADYKTPQLDISEPMILALPALFEPHKLIENGIVREDSVPRFGVTLLLKPTHPILPVIYQTILAVAQEHFPLVVQNGALPHRSLFSTPLENGDEYYAADPSKKYREPMRGHWLLRAGSPAVSRTGAERKPPPLSIVQDGKIVDLPFDETRKNFRNWFYGGANVMARIGFGPRKVGGAGVTAYLNLVVSLGTGDPIPALGSSEEYTPSARGSDVFGSSIQAHVGTVVPEGSPYTPGVNATSAEARPAGFAPPPGAGGFGGVRY